MTSTQPTSVKETMIFIVFITAAIRSLETPPSEQAVQEIIPFIFHSAAKRGMTTFELASSDQSLEYIKTPKMNKKQTAQLDLAHLLLCLVVLHYKKDLLTRQETSGYDLVAPPQTSHEAKALRWEISSLQHKIISHHRHLMATTKEVMHLLTSPKSVSSPPPPSIDEEDLPPVFRSSKPPSVSDAPPPEQSN